MGMHRPRMQLKLTPSRGHCTDPVVHVGVHVGRVSVGETVQLIAASPEGHSPDAVGSGNEEKPIEVQESRPHVPAYGRYMPSEQAGDARASVQRNA